MVLGGGEVLGKVRSWGRCYSAGEGGEGGEVSFSDGGFGGKHRPFSFRDEDGGGSCAGCGLGELPIFEIKYFQQPFSNAYCTHSRIIPVLPMKVRISAMCCTMDFLFEWITPLCFLL